MKHTPDSRSTQRSRILALLIEARGAWVPLPEILELGIAQYNARIFELRRLGFQILNRQERQGGQLHTFFRLVTGQVPPAHSDIPDANPAPAAKNTNQGSRSDSPGLPVEPQCSLFGDLSPERYPD